MHMLKSKAKGDLLSFGNKNHGLKTMREWQAHNNVVLKGDIIKETDDNTSITKNSIVKVNQTSCQDFNETTEQLKQRSRHIHFWKAELERAIRDLDAEIRDLETQRQQLKNAMDVIRIPEYINEECLDIRANRMQSDLVHDGPQEELFNETALIENIKRMQKDQLREMERQLELNISAKDDLENDWSHKFFGYKYESENIGLKTKSENVTDVPGSTRLCEGQSNVESWEGNTIDILKRFKNAYDSSKELRAKVEATLINSSRDLRSQDINVNTALDKRIAQTEQVKVELDNQLKLTLQKIAETENTLATLHDEIMRANQRLQVAQTRLNIKNLRPDVENCREGSLFNLLDEVKDLNDSITLLKNRYLKTEMVRADLIKERSSLENEIVVKKKSLFLDNDRCLYIRTHYQSAEKMCGY